MLIDTHTHLFLENFDHDQDEVIARALSKGVDMMLLPHIDKDSTQSMLHLAFRYPGNCIPMMGLHPGSVKENYPEELDWIDTNLKNQKFIALGEIGMDLYWDKTFQKEQEIVFRQHLEWAKIYNLPLVIHSRNAADELLKILNEYPAFTFRGSFHSFTGSKDQALKAVKLGFFIGIGGIVTFKNSAIDKIAQGIGLENILIETDSPFLAPVPHRGKRNESSYLPIIAEKLAEIFNCSFEKISEITTDNAMRLFDLKSFK